MSMKKKTLQIFFNLIDYGKLTINLSDYTPYDKICQEHLQD